MIILELEKFIKKNCDIELLHLNKIIRHLTKCNCFFVKLKLHYVTWKRSSDAYTHYVIEDCQYGCLLCTRFGRRCDFVIVFTA